MSLSPERRVVAAFDFDGTLTRGETLVRFLGRVCGRAAVARAFALESRRARDRDALKAALFARLLAGLPVAEVEAEAMVHARWILGSRLWPASVERVRWHLAQGHEVVVVSASPAIYVRPAVAHLGITTVLATELEVDEDGRLTGRLLGANVRGSEKVGRLQRHLGGKPVTLYAYGNDGGDRELLAAADVAVWHPGRLGRGFFRANGTFLHKKDSPSTLSNMGRQGSVTAAPRVGRDVSPEDGS